MPSTRNARYIDVLKLPHVRLTFLSALVGRSAYALVILPLLFAVQATSGSVATAGIAVAAYGVTASFLAPFRARLIDRHGRRPVLLLLSVAFGGVLIALAVGAFAAWTGATMVVLAGLAGSVAPPLGPAMRVAWAELAQEPVLLRKALSFDAVVEELLYLVGPAAAGFALVIIEPGLVLLVPAVLVVLGTGLFVSSPAIRHAPRTRNAGHSTSAPSTVRGPTLLGNTHFIGLLLPALVAGLVSGNLTIAIPAAFPGTSGTAAAGIVLGLFAGGSAVGGLIFGALQVPGRARFQVIAIAVILVALSSAIGLTGNTVWMTVTVVGAGAFFSPVMIVAYFAANDFGGDHRRTESTTWVNTSHNIGAAAGSALAGIVVQIAGVNASFLAIGALAVLILTGASVLAFRRIQALSVRLTR
ncbi:MFS transporter [Cryobacterium sp. Y11]|uniref:MFS transporter n=1 Tax=Cryobacterium sp. Y11 TaxID=2045016 RepID=UPI000CE42830|nr:MFS transporter [Cryobacterium sp. Y11]